MKKPIDTLDKLLLIPFILGAVLIFVGFFGRIWDIEHSERICATGVLFVVFFGATELLKIKHYEKKDEQDIN